MGSLLFGEMEWQICLWLQASASRSHLDLMQMQDLPAKGRTSFSFVAVVISLSHLDTDCKDREQGDMLPEIYQ